MDYILISTRKNIATSREYPLEYLWGLSKLQALMVLERVRQTTKRSRFDRVVSEEKDAIPTIVRQVRIAEFDPDRPSRQVSEVSITIMEDIPTSQLKSAFSQKY